MTEMKSAYERAMEKVAKLEKATPEEIMRLDAIPRGNRIAAQFMKDRTYDLDAEVTKYKGTGARKQIIEGALEIFMRYVALPANEAAKENIRRAKQGILLMKENKRAVEAAFQQLDSLLEYYEQARQQAFGQLKQAFEQRFGQQMRAAGAGLGTQPRMDVTAQPQFREEWTKVLGELNAQYEQALADFRHKLANVP